MDSLAAPTYTFVVTYDKTSHAEIVDGGQRVTNILSQITGDNAVSNAKASTGAAVFSSSDIEGKEDSFKESAQFLSKFPSMVKAVSNKSKDNEPNQDIEFSNDDQTTSTTVSAVTSPFLTDVADISGDALEWPKNAVKSTFKVIFKVYAKGLRLVLTIAGKVVSFVVEAVGPLIEAIGMFLKAKLGIDVEKLFQWLGLTWITRRPRLIKRYAIPHGLTMSLQD